MRASPGPTGGHGHVVGFEPLCRAVRLVVRALGSADVEVETVTTNLVDANLTGHDSHGVGLLPRYVDAVAEGGLRPNTHVRVVHDAGALLRLDGDAGFGQVIGREAMELGIGRARREGTCIVALGNSHHLGRIGAWAEQVAAAGLVSMHFVNVIARAVVAPYGGTDARFGTNPFAVGLPRPGRPPVILDFATSVIAQGKARVAMNKAERLPPGCLIDDHGRPTDDPRYAVVPPFGALLAFGAHKGSGLALVCELLGGALAGGLTQRDGGVGQSRVLNGMLSVLIDPGALGADGAFEREADAFLEWVGASPPGQGVDAVRTPGEPERESRSRRLRDGIPVDVGTWQTIVDAAARLGLDPAAVHVAAGLA